MINMNQKILKYNTLDRELKKNFSIEMPIGSKILCIHKDDKTKIPCIWALVDPDAEKEERFFELYKTDRMIDNDDGYTRKYIGTYHHQRDEFIEHLFERLALNTNNFEYEELFQVKLEKNPCKFKKLYTTIINFVRGINIKRIEKTNCII